MPTVKRKNVQDLNLVNLRAMKTKRAKLEGRVADLEGRVRVLEPLEARLSKLEWKIDAILQDASGAQLRKRK
jgi:uncharacterized protein involved in exopolysaccharide biosynthesis